jgi:hypothetical protein
MRNYTPKVPLRPEGDVRLRSLADKGLNAPSQQAVATPFFTKEMIHI